MRILLNILVNKKNNTEVVVDNTCGALARIILTHHKSSIPLDQILTALLDSLPLKEDHQENEPIIQCFIHLLKSGNNHAAKNMTRIIKYFASILGKLSQQGIQQEVIEILRSLNKNYNQQFRNVIQSLNQEEQQIISKVLQN